MRSGHILLHPENRIGKFRNGKDRMKSGTRRALSGLLAALLVAFAAMIAVSKGAASPDDRAANEKALRDADSAWSKAASALDVNRTVSYYADDASMFPPNAPLATGREAIRRAWTNLLVGYSGSWQATKVDVARGGDLAYIMGTYAGSGPSRRANQ
jgi:ketosteroid isomerase-like protein